MSAKKKISPDFCVYCASRTAPWCTCVCVCWWSRNSTSIHTLKKTIHQPFISRLRKQEPITKKWKVNYKKTREKGRDSVCIYIYKKMSERDRNQVNILNLFSNNKWLQIWLYMQCTQSSEEIYFTKSTKRRSMPLIKETNTMIWTDITIQFHVISSAIFFLKLKLTKVRSMHSQQFYTLKKRGSKKK